MLRRILPLSGCIPPASRLSRVDLPAPFGPITPRFRPLGIIRLKFLNTTRRRPSVVKVLEMLISSMLIRPTGETGARPQSRAWSG